MSSLPPVHSFAELLRPISEQATATVRGKKLVGHHAIEMDRLKKQAEEDGHSAGEKIGYEVGFEKGHADGLVQGHAEGLQDGFDEVVRLKQSEIDTLRDSLSELVRQVNAAMSEWFRASEPALAQLSALIATRVVAKELALGPDAVLAMTREAIAEVTHADSARIRINPFHSPVLAEHKAAIVAVSDSVRDVDIIDDPSLPGGCVIESDGGVVDARLDAKIFEILEAIRGAA